METHFAHLQAVCFDYGNTLIEFHQSQLRLIDSAMVAFLEQRLGPVDADTFAAMRYADRVRPYQRDCIESDLRDLFAMHIRRLYGIEADAALLDAMHQVRFDAFVSAVKPLPWVPEVLEALAPHYRMVVLSNYPDGNAIRVSLEQLDLLDRFEAVLVSGDLGYVKPHRRTFATVVETLDLPPQTILHIGDNWLADIQGAKRAGLAACHLTQWPSPEKFNRAPGDHAPDLVLDHLDQLPDALLGQRQPI
jgi:HAD superfamily hydrolase (TIGR01549 family)